MDQQQIKACIDAMSASDVAEMQFSQDGWTLRLVRRSMNRRDESDEVASTARTSGNASDSTPAPAHEARMPLCAPLYGVVHLSPGPDQPPFIGVGAAVTAGQVVCVIEAMKVFNQVRAEFDATIAEILVASGQEVEAGQPLLRFA
jgi:acetyl-CoA carboxylase biotin carboxyl carrier protein